MKFNTWKIFSICLFLLLLISVFTRGFYLWDFLNSPKKIAEKTLSYINENFLQGQTKASLISIKRENNGLYNLKFKIDGEEAEVFVSEDGKNLFIQKIPLAGEETEPQAQEIPKREKPDVKLFVMSYCPYGNEAEGIMKPVLDLLGNKTPIELRYIVSKQDGKFVSLHGDQEVNQDVREICLKKYQPEKLWDFILATNEKSTYQDSDQKWEGIAKELGIDVSKIKECQEKELGALLDEEIKLTEKYGITGSPTLVINDTISQARRTPEGYKEAICSGFKSPPQECSKKLEDSSVNPQGGC